MASCRNFTTSALVLKTSREGLSPSQKSGARFDPEIRRIRTKSSAAAWRRFRAKVRSSFCTLKSYLSSGKSCAIRDKFVPDVVPPGELLDDTTVEPGALETCKPEKPSKAA